MKKLRQTYHIKAPVKKVWQALVDPTAIEEWGAGPAKMGDKVGTRFELWGGDIHGVNTEVVKEKKLAQDWFAYDWRKASKVTFTLEPEEGGTKVVLVHENVPDNEYNDIRDGWRQYYLGPMKRFLEDPR
jgi:uncharacterized protein YndB with AHSA1/START domain